jgi:hypothetical protein
VSNPFAFICTETTADPVIPASSLSPAEFQRKVAGYTQAIAGGVLEAGTIKWRATQGAISNHLLCDGSLQDPLRFPDLFRVIGTTFGGDGITTFALPDYSGALTVATPTVTQTIDDGGTVSTEETVVTDAGAVGGSTGGNVVTGGRLPRIGSGENQD